MSSRREARERALGLAYESEQRNLAGSALLAELPVAPDEYAQQLVLGIEAHRDEIDAMIRKYSEHWALERMPVLDRALLRIGAFELGWMPDVPTAAVITEAVELAKQYSTKDSGRFVNGLLSRIAEDRPPRAGVVTVRLDTDTESITVPDTVEELLGGEEIVGAHPWVVIVWDDPVNTMRYVVYVFQKLFGYSRGRDETHVASSQRRQVGGERRDS